VIARSIPGSRLVVIPEVAHLMSYQNPAGFNDVLLDSWHVSDFRSARVNPA
jgi:pimeloyl-ACP methyl ester carboxylesterase